MKTDLIQVDGKFYKKHQIVMLATEKPSKLNLHTETQVLRLGGNIKSLNETAINQHLYILSNICKNGEWYLDKDTNTVKKNETGHELSYSQNCFGIVATTDSSLTIKENVHPLAAGNVPLPRPSDAFVQKFVKEYNRGNVISEVLIEYENAPFEDENNPADITYKKLKIVSDNTITIKKIEETWTDVLKNYGKSNNLSMLHSEVFDAFVWLRENYQVPKKK
jgi:hypothetical protein